MKRALLNLFIKFLNHKDIREQLYQEISRCSRRPDVEANLPSPYYQYEAQKTAPSDAVFISSRFRSGSTMLWNIFRNIEGITSYYEPFNERQWFNKSIRGTSTDKTHLNVDDYWLEYDGLESLSEFYDQDWIEQDLLLNEFDNMPAMKKFIQAIIQHTTGRPVLQFNRIDFRLPWIKVNFPSSPIIHLYRNPRDQWLSFLRPLEEMSADTVERTYIDRFYLNSWCNDLKKYFPFLDVSTTPHPYKRFYYLWKLSYIYGVEHGDYSLSFEELVSTPETALKALFSALGIDEQYVSSSKQFITPVPLNKWKTYASEEWFETLENDCEHTISHWLKGKENA